MARAATSTTKKSTRGRSKSPAPRKAAADPEEDTPLEDSEADTKPTKRTSRRKTPSTKKAAKSSSSETEESDEDQKSESSRTESKGEEQVPKPVVADETTHGVERLLYVVLFFAGVFTFYKPDLVKEDDESNLKRFIAVLLIALSLQHIVAAKSPAVRKSSLQYAMFSWILIASTAFYTDTDLKREIVGFCLGALSLSLWACYYHVPN